MRREEEKLNRAGVLINEFPWQSLNYAAIAVVMKSRGIRAPSSRRPLEDGGECQREAAHHRAARAGQSPGLGRARGWGCAWADFG